MFRGTILLIDRFSRMNTLINSYLSASGFVVECMRSVDDLRTVRLNMIHLALLDIDTAGGRLKEILEQMKSAGVPVIVLTSESDHAREALRAGAGRGGRNEPPSGHCGACRKNTSGAGAYAGVCHWI